MKYLLIIFLFINCVIVDTKIRHSKKPVFFSNIPSNTEVKTIDFEIDQTNFYWLGKDMPGNKDVNFLIEEKLNQYPNSLGIKKLKIRVYNKTWYSYNLLPNPLSIFTGTGILIGHLIGFTNKSIFLQGEIYF